MGLGAYTPTDEMAGANKRVGRAQRFARLAREVAGLTPAELAFASAAFAIAPVVKASLASRGLEGTLAVIERAMPARRPRAGVDVGRGARLVRWAFRRSDGTCLPESLVQLALHRWFGPEVELVVGVRREDAHQPAHSVGWELHAHAWIECGGGPPADAAPFEPILRRRLGP